MESKPDNDLSYKGTGKWMAALDGFFANSAGALAGGAAIIFALTKISKRPMRDGFIMEMLQDKWTWIITGSSGLIGALSSYDKAAKAKEQHDRLLADNKAMRSQLNQTGQILNHVADQIGKGKIADSQLSVSEDAPPSHVARLEAHKAAEAAQQVLSK